MSGNIKKPANKEENSYYSDNNKSDNNKKSITQSNISFNDENKDLID